MASNLLLVVFLVLVSLSITSGHSLSTRDAVSKQNDESYVIATSNHEPSMIVVEDLIKTRSLLAGSKVVVSKAGSKSSSSKSKKDKKKKEKKKKKKSRAALVGGIIAAVFFISFIVYVIVFLLYDKLKDQRIFERGTDMEGMHGSSETQSISNGLGSHQAIPPIK